MKQRELDHTPARPRKPPRLRIIGLSIMAGAVLACAPSAIGQGTLVFYQPPSPIPVFQQAETPSSLDLDLNFDGQVDFVFNLSTSGVSVEPGGMNRVAAIQPPLPNLQGALAPLPSGYVIGSSLSGGYSWVGSLNPLPNVTIGPFMSGCFDGNCQGLFLGQTASMGLEFQINGETHYGWALLQGSSTTGGGHILSWAYNTVPGGTLITPVPEPASVILVLAGLGILLVQRTRTRT